jgi:hypothetical protein
MKAIFVVLFVMFSTLAHAEITEDTLYSFRQHAEYACDRGSLRSLRECQDAVIRYQEIKERYQEERMRRLENNQQQDRYRR